MFLDLASTITGGVLVLVGEGIALGLFMLWALMSTGKKADEQMEDKQSELCPLEFDFYNCSGSCVGWNRCHREWKV